MTEQTQELTKQVDEQMQKAINHLESDLQKVRAGKASTQMLEGVMVEYYGSMTPITNVASLSTPDARTIVVQPWEKSSLTPIEKAIQAANLGFNPQNDGVIIRIIVPPLTEERRKDLVKKAKAEAENCKVSIRTIRKTAMEAIKKMQKDGLPEDTAKSVEQKIQIITDNYSTKADKHLENKEKEILTV